MGAIQLLSVTLALTLAVAAQAGSGSGFGVVAAPLLAIWAPEALPGPLLAVTIPLMVAVLWQNRQSMSVAGILPALIAAAPGAALGAILLPILGTRVAALVTGVVVLTGAVAALFGWKIVQDRPRLAVAGLLAGAAGALVAVPGPPLVAVYRDADVSRYRANLALFFAATSLVALLALALVGGFGAEQWITTAALLPGLVTGGLVGVVVVRAIPARIVRPVSLGLSAVAGVCLLFRALVP